MKKITALIAIAFIALFASCQNKVKLVNPDIIKSDAAGNVYVMQRYDKIIKFNQNNEILFEIGKKDEFKKNYSYPWHFDVDEGGDVYVVYIALDYKTGKTAREEIVKYNSRGKFEKIVFQIVYTREEMEKRAHAYSIMSIALSHTTIYAVLSQEDGSVELLKISLAGEVMGRSALDIGTLGDMCVSKSGTIIMTDIARNQIMSVNDSGRVLRRFGTTGVNGGDFRCPISVCVDDRENVYVCDEGNRRIQKLNSNSGFVSFFKNPAIAQGPNDIDLRSITPVKGDFYAIELLGNRIIVFGPDGEIKREISHLLDAGYKRFLHITLLFLGLLLGAVVVVVLLRLAIKAFQLKIGVRLIVLFAGTGVAVVFVVSILIYSISYKNYENEIREKYLTIAQMLAAEIKYEDVEMVKGTEDEIYQKLLNKFKVVVKKSSNIDWIGLYLVDDKHFYYGIDTGESGVYTPIFKISRQHLEVLKSGRPGYFEYKDESGTYLAAVAPITNVNGEVKTILEVSCDLGFLKEYRKTIFYNVLWVSVVCIVIFCLISVLLSLTITSPIKDLTLGAMAVEKGRFDFRLKSKHQHEVGRFINTFNAMMVSLSEKEKIRSIMNKVVSKEVAYELLKNKIELGGAERHASILFSDIRGFTTIAENMEPADLIIMLNEYFSRMSPLVDKEGGVIDKYIGDAIMAIFGAPLEFPDDSMRAVRAGVTMINELKSFNENRIEMNLVPIKIGVGINSGNVVAGNIGSENRLNYTIIGDAVNLASRLEGLTKYYGVEMIISEEVADQVKDSFVLRELDVVRVKGKKEGCKIFEVMVRNEDKWIDTINIFKQAMIHYRAQQWDEAEAYFQKVLEVEPSDNPSRIYIARINQYRLQPPPHDWDGVYVAK